MKWSHLGNFITYLPIILLIILAANHIRLFKTIGASAWYGGGFGMFATIDSVLTRRLIAMVTVNNQTEEIDLSSYSDAVKDVLLLPTDSMLIDFANRVACDRTSKSSTQEFLSLAYYNSAFDDETFTVTSKLVKSLTQVQCDRQ